LDQKLAEEIASFRYRLISPIVSRENLHYRETTQSIRDASKRYQIPGSRKTKVSYRTIERYLKQYREGGYEALKPMAVSQPMKIPKDREDPRKERRSQFYVLRIECFRSLWGDSGYTIEHAWGSNCFYRIVRVAANSLYLGTGSLTLCLVL
jgi:transposase